MKSIILIGDKTLSLDEIQKIKFENCISYNVSEYSLGIELESGRLYLDYSDDIALDYDKEELDKILIKNPNFISVEYSNLESLKELLQKMENFKELLVDDDKGNIVNLKMYLKNIII